MLNALWRGAREDAERLALAHGGAVRLPEANEFKREVRRHPDVRVALERMWPRLSPAQLVLDLLGSEALIASAGSGSALGSRAGGAADTAQRVG